MRYCWVWVLVSIFSVIHGCNENGAKTDEPDGSDQHVDTGETGNEDTGTDANVDIDTDDVDSTSDKSCGSDFDCYGEKTCSNHLCVNAGVALVNPSTEINSGVVTVYQIHTSDPCRSWIKNQDHLVCRVCALSFFPSAPS